MELRKATSGVDLISFWGADDSPRSVFAIDHMRHSLLNWWCPMRERTVKRERGLYDIDTLLRLPTGSSYRDVHGYVDWEVGRHENFEIPIEHSVHVGSGSDCKTDRLAQEASGAQSGR